MRFKRLFLIFTITISLIYLIIGPISQFVSVKIFHDYPMPKLRLSNKAEETHQIDWLMVHGIASTASIWDNIINACNNLQLAAVSVGNHDNLPSVAYPDTRSGDDITKFLSENKSITGVIGHSTAAMWMASSYKKCPKCWDHVSKIILVAPNFAINLKGFNQFTKYKTLTDIVSLIFPDTYWVVAPTAACIGTSAQNYSRCINTYMSGRKVRLDSANYYKILLNYMENKQDQADTLNFLQEKAKHITIVLAKNDALIDNTITLEIANKLHIPTEIFTTSHTDLINYFQQWLLDCKKPMSLK